MAGQPWVMLAPATLAPTGAAGEKAVEWPDFEAHWKRHFSHPISGPTATEMLAEDKEDRF